MSHTSLLYFIAEVKDSENNLAQNREEKSTISEASDHVSINENFPGSLEYQNDFRYISHQDWQIGFLFLNYITHLIYS